MRKTQQTFELGKVPPQAIDIEEAVLSSILLEAHSFDLVAPILKPESFYKHEHQKIFECIIEMRSKESKIDLMTVTNYMMGKGVLEEAGGIMYITNLSAKVISTAHVEFHAKIIAEKYVQRELIRYSMEISQKSFDSEDVAELMDYANTELTKLSEVFHKGLKNVPFNQIVNNSVNEYYEWETKAKEGSPIGIKTPINDLTSYLRGFQKSDLIVLAARPSMGKTALALAFIRHAAKQGENPVMFSLEMSSIKLAHRMILGESGVDPDRYYSGQLTEDEKDSIEKALGKIENLNIEIDDNPNSSMEYIRAKSNILARRNKCSMVVIDYLGLISTSGINKKEIREQQIAEMSRQAKTLAKDLNIPVLLLSQLNRKCEERSDKRPRMSDLRESGAVEQDADVVMLLYRAEHYGFSIDEKGQSVKHKGEIIIDKNRNGKTGVIKFAYNIGLTNFFDYSDEFHSLPQDVKSKQLPPEKTEYEQDLPF